MTIQPEGREAEIIYEIELQLDEEELEYKRRRRRIINNAVQLAQSSGVDTSTLAKIRSRYRPILEELGNNKPKEKPGMLKIQIEEHTLEYSYLTGSVTVNGEEIDLTANEAKVFRRLASYPGKTFSKEALQEAVRKSRDRAPKSNIIAVTISAMRGKLERDPNEPKIIETVTGHGYRLNRRNIQNADLTED